METGVPGFIYESLNNLEENQNQETGGGNMSNLQEATSNLIEDQARKNLLES